MNPNPSAHWRSVAGILLAALTGHVTADVSLSDLGLNHDGTITGLSDPLPPGSTFDTTTGLGLIRMDFTGAGAHSALLFVDHQFSVAVNTAFNEFGTTSLGAPPAGLSWEIDNPAPGTGDIRDHFVNDVLDDSNALGGADDVSMATGWNFVLGANEAAFALFDVSLTQPPGGFFLHQFDPDSNESVFLLATLHFEEIPETGTRAPMIGLLAAGITAYGWRHRRCKPLAGRT